MSLPDGHNRSDRKHQLLPVRRAVSGVLALVVAIMGAACWGSVSGAETVAVTFGGVPMERPAGLTSFAVDGGDLPPLLGYLSLSQFQAFATKVLGASPAGTPVPKSSVSIFLSDDELLHSWMHLARERGLEPEITDIHRWRVVAGVLEHGAAGEADRDGAAEVRLIAQPLTIRATGLISHDYAMHLSYTVNDIGRFSQDIAFCRGLTPSENNGADPKRFLWQALLSRYATPNRLTRIAWSTSSQSGQHWTFGSLVRDADNSWHLAELPGGGYFDNFSKPEMLRGKSGINREQSPTLQAAFSTDGGLNQSTIVEIARLQDPGRSRRSEGLCVACHMADQLATLQNYHGNIFNDNGVTIFGTARMKLGNQRQIGFRYDGKFWLSSRMIRTLE